MFYLQEEDAEISPVTEAITLAVQQSGGRALGGRAIFIPLLERCGTETTVQIARFPHPQLPSLRAQLSVPQLRFFISPARVRRVLRVLRAAMPGDPSFCSCNCHHLLHPRQPYPFAAEMVILCSFLDIKLG